MSKVVKKNHVIVLEGDYSNDKDDFFTYYYRILYNKFLVHLTRQYHIVQEFEM